MRWLMAIGVAAVVLAAPAVAQTPATVVPFVSGSDAPGPKARAALDAFAKSFKGDMLQVSIAGHATVAEAIESMRAEGDTGTQAELEKVAFSYAIGLSQRRAANVRSYLADRGVPDGVMTTEAFGASRPVDPSGKPSAADRRVEITTGPGSGW